MDDIPEPLTNIGCQEILSEEYTHSGWVRKRAFINKIGAIRWPQVYMVLANGCIYYFNNDYSKAPHGKFSLYGYNAVKRDKEVSIKQAPFPFRIEHSNPDFKTYIFAASSEKEMKEWMKYIKGQMVSANGQTAENYYYTYRKAGKIIKQAADDDKSLTYQEIETDIYASGAFKPSKDYSAKFKVKLKDEDSDDEELQRVPAPPPRKRVDPRDRPPQPIPTDQDDGPPTYAAPKVPPRNKEGAKTDDDDAKPEVKSRTRQKADSPTHKHHKQPFDELQAELKAAVGESDKQERTPREKGKHRKRRDQENTSGHGERKHRSQRDKEEDPYVKMKALRNGVQENEADGNGAGAEEEEAGMGEEELDERKYWDAIYFKEEDKEKANEIIRNIGEEGAFLVRPGENNSQVLVVFADNYPKKFKIQEQNNEFFLAKDGPHEHNLEMLLYVYHTQELPTAKVMLNTPYKLHAKYKK